MMRLCRNLTLLMVWLFLAATPMETIASDEYRTDLLQLMAEKSGLRHQLDTLGEGTHIAFATYKSYPVTATVHDGRIVHLGVTVFNQAQRQGFEWIVCDFLERYCLELLIPANPDIPVQERLRMDGVSVRKGSFNVRRLRDLCCDTTLCMNLQTTPKGYILGWRRGEEWIELLTFPMEYDLLAGTDMDERERRLPDEVRRVSGACDTLPDRQQLVKSWGDNYYTLSGGTYLLSVLKGDNYFEVDEEGKLRPMYNKVYIIESLANLLTTNLVDNQFVLDIHLRKYGFKTDTLSVPLMDWVAYARKTGCKPFFGIIQQDEQKVTCELIWSNRAMGYNHIMRIDFPQTLLGQRMGHIKARLNSFVNSSRIMNLFDDKKQYNP